MNEELVDRLLKHPDMIIFQSWAREQIDKLDSVADLDKMSNSEAGEEAKVRAKAKEKLLDIFGPFFNAPETKEKTAEDIDKANKKFGM